MGVKRRLLTTAAAATLLATLTAPTASAGVGLSPGTELHIGDRVCSLGFLATNAAGTRLAVTAGHCADDTDQKVYSHNHNLIGVVCHHTPDHTKDGTFGVTLICLSSGTYTADAYFTTYGDPSVGDYVKKYGERTDKTEGKITSIHTDPHNPARSQMKSTLVGLPGDSGSTWVGGGHKGPKLLGLNIGHTTRPDGGYGYAFGFPINSLITLVKQNSPKWGPGFIPIGP
jgi:hypothetical protein